MWLDRDMEETTTPIVCDEHYFVTAEIDEVYGEEDDYGRRFTVTRFYCPVKGCTATKEEA